MDLATFIDPGTMHGIGTVMLMLAFIGLCVWAYSPSQRARFEEDARMPFREDPGEDASERSVP